MSQLKPKHQAIGGIALLCLLPAILTLTLAAVKPAKANKSTPIQYVGKVPYAYHVHKFRDGANVCYMHRESISCVQN